MERQEFIIEEIRKLEAEGLVRGVLHPTWLANPVVVRKANGKWRLCIDYTDINKVCPKDPFPLPHIDQIVDSTAGCDLLSFLDDYSGYHQIFMTREDEEKTAQERARARATAQARARAREAAQARARAAALTRARVGADQAGAQEQDQSSSASKSQSSSISY